MTRSVVLILGIATFLLHASARGQRVPDPIIPSIPGYSGYRYQGWHSPASVLSSRVYAQAALVRATGTAAVDFSIARQNHAAAVRAELRNKVERVNAYLERRRIGEEERARRKIDPEARRREINSKTWQKLRLHPDINSRTIATGTALNFLFYRLSATALTWDPSDPKEEFSSATLAHLTLTPEVLHQIRLEQSNSGTPLVFRADEGVPLQIDWWPYLLRDDRFQKQRQELIDRRSKLIEDAADGMLSKDSLENLELASANLSTKFRSRFTRSRSLSGGTKTFREWRDATMFLRAIDREIARLQSTGDTSSLDESLKFAPEESERHLPALLSFMSRNGLRFAPPNPGEEAAYFTAFDLLRDFYLAWDDTDEGIKDPKTANPSS